MEIATAKNIVFAQMALTLSDLNCIIAEK